MGGGFPPSSTRPASRLRRGRFRCCRRLRRAPHRAARHSTALYASAGRGGGELGRPCLPSVRPVTFSVTGPLGGGCRRQLACCSSPPPPLPPSSPLTFSLHPSPLTVSPLPSPSSPPLCVDATVACRARQAAVPRGVGVWGSERVGVGGPRPPCVRAHHDGRRRQLPPSPGGHLSRRRGWATRGAEPAATCAVWASWRCGHWRRYHGTRRCPGRQWVAGGG